MTIICSVAWKVPMMLTPRAQGVSGCPRKPETVLVNVLGNLCREEIGWAEHLGTTAQLHRALLRGFFFFIFPGAASNPD